MEWTEVAEDLLDRTGIATHPGSDDINGWVRNAAGRPAAVGRGVDRGRRGPDGPHRYPRVR